MEHFQHFVKKDFSKFGVSYASCGPSSLQGGIEVSERGDVVPLSEVNFGPQLPHTSSFINQTITMDLQQKRKIRRYLSVYTMVTGNQVPSGLNLVHKQ